MGPFRSAVGERHAQLMLSGKGSLSSYHVPSSRQSIYLLLASTTPATSFSTIGSLSLSQVRIRSQHFEG